MEDIQAQIGRRLAVLGELRASSGLFLAAAQEGVSTGYDKAWLRDNFYATLAYEEIGAWEEVRETWRAVLDLFLKHKGKISWAAENRPHESYQYIHARYHPETFEEFWEEWGNKQNDAVGAVLYKFAELEERDMGIIETDEDLEMVQTLMNYLNSVEYWHDPDNGVWEEYEEVHASSVGAVVGALVKWQRLGTVKIPEGMLENGWEALEELLPRESDTKFADLAQLSLIYPYGVVNEEMTKEILENIEYHLVKKSGVLRYKNDHYYNKNEDEFSEEAEWTMGFPWLSIIYTNRGEQEKAKMYLDKTYAVLTAEDMLPELYYSNTSKPNENVPLGWAESLYGVALSKYQKAFEENIE